MCEVQKIFFTVLPIQVHFLLIYLRSYYPARLQTKRIPLNLVLDMEARHTCERSLSFVCIRYIPPYIIKIYTNSNKMKTCLRECVSQAIRIYFAHHNMYQLQNKRVVLLNINFVS